MKLMKHTANALAVLLATTFAPALNAKTPSHLKATYHSHGTASYYGGRFHGRTTASGEVFDENDWTAAHLELPFGTQVKVTNLKNKKSTVVTINDRGPYTGDRVIDVSKRVAKELGFVRHGVAKVKLEILHANAH
ncbi:MAG: septal ring lytic transglycosylase RlpA family protein [Thiotrichales bacterium]